MDLLSDLTGIGFTEYEAKVYLALLRENPATGYQLSKKAGVPRSMVYEALGRLHARGAVLKTDDHRAMLFRPVPPDILLDRYEREQHNLIDGLRDNLLKLYQAQEEDRFWSIKDRSSVLAYAIQMIEEAQTELLLVLSDPDIQALGEKIRQSCARGVAVSALLTGEGDLDCGEIARHPPLESELQELTDMMVVVADGKECLISGGDIERTATITTNRNLVLIARQFVWMELFAQRLHSQLGDDSLAVLEPLDRRILESFSR